MSILTDVYTYWQNNVTLQGVLPVGAAPAGKVWTGIAADKVQLPFVVLNEIVSQFNPTVGTWYYDLSTLQISIYHSGLALALSLGDTVAAQFDRRVIGAGYMVAVRQDSKTLADPGGAYHVMLSYVIGKNGLTAT